tara:strand:+ start:436 stop:705 length:270 start_codon:yes stop_codon:yes gene_type:complete
MQEIFEMDPASRSDFIALISPERFSRYLQAAQGDEARAIALYWWNMRVGQSLWVSLQCWEIAFRNQMDRFLRWKYSASWPYDERRCEFR